MSQRKQNKKTEEKIEQENYGNMVLSWVSPEFIKHPKGRLWFIIAGLIVIAVIFYSILKNSWSTAVVFTVLAGVYFLQQRTEARNIQIIISEIGVKVGENFYPYNQIKFFWIIYDPPFVKTLNFKTTNRIFPQITIQLNDQNPALVRNYLVQQIPEIEGKEESFSDILIRMFRL